MKNTLYQMAPCGASQMMGYLVATKDGKLFAIDGGTKAETETFLSFARKIQGCKDGEKLHLDGWFLTHAHDDHIDVFLSCMRDHADEIQIDRLFYHFPSTEYQEKYEKIFAYSCHDMDAVQNQIRDFAVIVHAGDSFDFGEVRFDILTEPDESITVNTGNNTSVAIRMTMDGQTVLFLGDMGVEQGEAFLKHYGADALKSDFVEMAHHGQNGVDFPVYEAIRPKACLWCTPDWLWKNDAGQGYGTGPWKTLIVRCWMQDLGVRYHFIEKDGIAEISFPFSFEKNV